MTKVASRSLLCALCFTFLVGCGDQSGPAGETQALTHRALAAVMLDHLPHDTTSRGASWRDEDTPHLKISTDFRYPAGANDDGDLVQVSVTPAEPDTNDTGQAQQVIDQSRTADCPTGKQAASCVVLANDAAGILLLTWWEQEPQEDPGGFRLSHVRATETVEALSSGPTLRRDPREADLHVTVEMLRKVVTDPRIALAATPEVLSAGEDADSWKGGEPDPEAYDRVPQSGIGLTSAYLAVAENHELFREAVPSPHTSLLGPDAIGGRLLPSGEGRGDGVTIDILATAETTPSFPDNLCQIIAAVDCAASHVRVSANVSWWLEVSADQKQAVMWVARLSPDRDSVLVRAEGPISDTEYAPFDLGLVMFDDALQEPGRLGMTTTKETLEWSLADYIAEMEDYEREYEEEERKRQVEIDQG